MQDIATDLLAGIVIATVSAWIAVQLSLKRFRTERWWERKVMAYERVIEALHHSKASCEASLAELEEGRILEERQKQDLLNQARRATLDIQRATDVGGFLLSSEAQARLKQFRKESREASNFQDWYRLLRADWTAIDSSLTDLIRIAKKDLQTK